MVPTSDINFVQAKADKYNKGVKDPNKTSFNIFVDDSLFVQVASNIEHAMAASIEALYIVLGYPDLEKRQSPLSLEKYFESICSYMRIQLGIQLNTKLMSIALTDDKRLAMVAELSHWHKKRRGFTLMQGVTLCGNLEFWANTSPWARFLYLSLCTAVNQCMFNCSKITKNKINKENDNRNSSCQKY